MSQTWWAEGPYEIIKAPYPKDANKPTMFEEGAIGMAVIHNSFLRCLNSIYHQAPHVSPSESLAFLEYVRAWCVNLEAHHDGEEANIFPFIDDKSGIPGLMDTNRHQHAAFHDGLAGLKEYAIEGIKTKGEGYDGVKVKGMVEAFGPTVRTHLADEIPSLLALEQYGEKMDGLVKIMEKDGEENAGKVGMTGLLQVLLCHDAGYQNGRFKAWPEFLPWPVNFFVRNVLILQHSAWWKFSPCDKAGRPKPEPYARPA